MEVKEKKGIIFALMGYFVWGILPIYWRNLKGVSAFELLYSRIILSFVSLNIYLLVIGRFKEYTETLKDMKIMKKIVLSAAAISINWGIYTYTMVSDKIIEASLAYYICPLIMTLIGLVVFKEIILDIPWIY